MKVHLPSIGIGVGVIVAVIVVVSLFGHGMPNPMTSTEQQGSTLDNTVSQNSLSAKDTLSLLVDHTSPVLGSDNAPITMIEFGDYQCFFCNKFYHTIEPDVVKNYIDTGKVRMVFKDFVIIGQDSVNAAHAAHCAQEQNKFWQYHDALYNNWNGENTGWASSANLLKFAKDVGLNDTQFSQCMAQSKYISTVQGSLSDAKGLGLTGTPDFFIISPDKTITKIEGAQPFSVFDELFKSKLK